MSIFSDALSTAFDGSKATLLHAGKYFVGALAAALGAKLGLSAAVITTITALLGM